ncbi:hypothetical protein Prudu_401S000100 [Prunus dulcis]|uniref:Uncharacterized protein n=1 Tax=Prunus dulcis TaxID=3755 RepID=A0A5H2Y101_PRUDU|nr:hypothetical protein Prudu_401S000100 [Prunus dulcis]
MEDASPAEEGSQPGYAPTGGALGERLLEGVKSDPRLCEDPSLPSLTGPKDDPHLCLCLWRDVQAEEADEQAKRQSGGGAGGHPREERLAGSEGCLAREVEELKKAKAEEVAAARVEAIESFRSSEELKSYIMDRLVDEQLRWEDRLVRFNPSLDINFDTSGEPPAQTPPADASTPTPEAEPATEDAPSTES